MTGKYKSDISSFLSHVPGTRANNIPQPFITRSVLCGLTPWKKVAPCAKLRICIIQMCAQHIVVLQHSVFSWSLETGKSGHCVHARLFLEVIYVTNEREYLAGDADEKHSSDKEPVAFLSYLITGDFLQSAQHHWIDSNSALQGHFGESCARMSRNSVCTLTSALLYQCILQPLLLTELYCCHEVPLNPKPVALHTKQNRARQMEERAWGEHDSLWPGWGPPPPKGSLKLFYLV